MAKSENSLMSWKFVGEKSRVHQGHEEKIYIDLWYCSIKGQEGYCLDFALVDSARRLKEDSFWLGDSEVEKAAGFLDGLQEGDGFWMARKLMEFLSYQDFKLYAA